MILYQRTLKCSLQHEVRLLRRGNATGQGIGKHNNFQMRRMWFNQF